MLEEKSHLARKRLGLTSDDASGRSTLRHRSLFHLSIVVDRVILDFEIISRSRQVSRLGVGRSATRDRLSQSLVGGLAVSGYSRLLPAPALRGAARCLKQFLDFLKLFHSWYLGKSIIQDLVLPIMEAILPSLHGW